MNVVSKAKYRARLAKDQDDLARAVSLRQHCFRPLDPSHDDRDALDTLCRHLLVEDVETSDLVACCRLLGVESGAAIGQSYSAGHYDLAALSSYPMPMMEIGRFCLDPLRRDPDILRVAWAAVTSIVDRSGARMLFGCSSFPGASGDQHRAALTLLAKEHRAPEKWQPGRKSPVIYDFAAAAAEPIDLRAALAGLPPLLRSYLSMGGWVSDHAVIDHDLDTLHVFTGLEVAAIPEVRARALRMAAAEIGLGDLAGD